MGLGPVEWGVVVAHRPYGLNVRLEASGEVGMLDRMQSHDSYMRRNPEYWPDVGDRIRVRRMEARPGGELRLVSFQTALNGWSEPEEVVRRHMYEWPAGLSDTEHGVITALHDRGFDVRLLASGETGTVMWSLVEADRMFFSTDFHPSVGQPIRVRRLGVWPDGTLRLSHRKTFLDIPLDQVRKFMAEGMRHGYRPRKGVPGRTVTLRPPPNQTGTGNKTHPPTTPE
ncbi:hypothetical protein [Actinomyces sp. oral taxon 897]|uniref:hypothetical protein n=1 Tax=Actinomyces sp. oral taxon 897 TaxID=2081702 RepID=UPI000D038B49|nr:hypothetical protein [Actinomyces sp. oral taxon 897]AVM62416.1 hypothetical protein C3V41_10685 [Actinomyces sp. oral taxon 897]